MSTSTQIDSDPPVYTPRFVEKILKNLMDIRYTLTGKSFELPDTYAVSVQRHYQEGRVPFGMTPSSQPWPFMEHKRATTKTDGKANARLMEELHVAALDIEDAVSKLTEDDQKIVFMYYIYQTHTLDELAVSLGLRSRGSTQQRVQRIVNKITRLVEPTRSRYHE